MHITTQVVELPLRHPFTIAHGTTTVSRSVIVTLEHEGCRGFGEACESKYYGASVEKICHSLDSLRQVIENTRPDRPDRLWSVLRRMTNDTFALCAVDCAMWDLWGKLQNRTVWQLLGLDISAVPRTDYTIGIDSPEKMLAKFHEVPDWPIYKVKMGYEHDIEVVRMLRSRTRAVIRVDANCGWTLWEAMAKIKQLADLQVELIEQPLSPEKLEEMSELYQQSRIPLIADESCRTAQDLAACVGRFHGVNIKLVKCGGITPAYQLLRQARERGFQTMLGCMTESSVAISAAAQLLPLADYADLDGAMLLAQDIASGVRFERGDAVFPDTPGCGITMLS